VNQLDMMWEPVRAFLHQLGDFLPRVAAALLVLLVGWFIAKAARFAVVKGLRAINLHVMTERAGLDALLRAGGLQSDTVALLGLLVHWLVIFGALLIGFNTLGLAYVTEFVSRVMLFLPRLMLGVLILAFGAYFARFLGNTIVSYCRSASVPEAELIGRAARYAMLVFVFLVVLDQVGVGGDIIRQTFLILFAGVVFALALAFGLGGRHWAAELLERWWPRRK
jgi:hypothetical protein